MNTIAQDEIYISALLHDIGKPIERTKYFKLNEKWKSADTRYSHPKHSGFTLEFLKVQLKESIINDNIINLSAFHHKPRKIEEKIIQLADWLSSSERVEEQGIYQKGKLYYHYLLQSILPKLYENKGKYVYNLSKLSLANLFPKEELEIDSEITKMTDKYKNLVENFLEELKYCINDKDKLLFLLEKYFSFIPAQTPRKENEIAPDISLFDHSKTTAAIALCLYQQWKLSKLTDEKIKYYTKEIDNIKTANTKEDEHFLLVSLDLSGIQNFIFNIVSKKAAASLKGRSVYLVLLMEVITKFIIQELNLEMANVLFCSGGHASILIPKAKENELLKIRKEILSILLQFHKGDIYLAINWIPVKISDFEDFSNVWTNAGIELSKLKHKRWSELNLGNNFNNIFGPFPAESRKQCFICHSYDNVTEKLEGEEDICEMCNSLKILTDSLSKANYLILEEKETPTVEDIYEDIHNVFSQFGYSIRFSEKSSNNGKNYKLNEIDLKNSVGWKFGVFNIKEREFTELAKKSDGDNKLALLKLDVDNLGLLFSKGFNKSIKKRSISRITGVSRFFDLFFKWEVNDLVSKDKYASAIYPIFSGGDDTFFIGAWDKIFDFVSDFKKRFDDYFKNPEIHFSASITIVPAKFPIIRSAKLAEENLEKAKHFIYPKEEIAEKNKITIFNEVFTWKEFDRIRDIKEEICELIKKGESRAIIQKMYNATKGFEKIMTNIEKDKFEPLKIWRFGYYLRTLKSKEDKEKLIKTFEDIFFQSYKIKKINPMILQVACRWAELLTKKGV